MATAKAPERINPKAEVRVYDHHNKSWGTITNVGFDGVKNEVFTAEDGRKYMRYTKGEKLVPAPKVKKAEDQD